MRDSSGQLASEVIGSNATLEEFLVEWWDTYAVTHLRPNTLAGYTTLVEAKALRHVRDRRRGLPCPERAVRADEIRDGHDVLDDR